MINPGDIVCTFWSRRARIRVEEVCDWHGAKSGQMVRLDPQTFKGPIWVDAAMVRPHP